MLTLLLSKHKTLVLEKSFLFGNFFHPYPMLLVMTKFFFTDQLVKQEKIISNNQSSFLERLQPGPSVFAIANVGVLLRIRASVQ